VGDAAGVDEASARVGSEIGVLVGGAGGSVGVLNGADRVNCASMVCAACVNTVFGSPTCWVADGRLQDESMNINRMVKDKTVRMNLDMVFSLS